MSRGLKTNGGNKKITKVTASALGVASVLGVAGVFGASAAAITITSGAVQLNAEVATAIAMKVASPNDTDPTCQTQAGVTYGTANRYSTSNGAEGSKQVDTFDGTPGGADELNTNTSCATLTMDPNTFSSTYSDVTVYTNNPNGYSLTLRSATGASPNLVNLDDDTVFIPAGALTEVDGTGEQAGTKVVPGAQNKWAYKTDANGNIDTWTAVTASDATIRAYDMETSGGSNTRVTYGISAGANPAGRYGTTLTYTATIFDGDNPYVPAVETTSDAGLVIDTNKLRVPYKATRSLTIAPAEGHYLNSLVCSEGYVCADENGDPIATGETVNDPVIVYVTNTTNKTGTGSLAATSGTNNFTVTASATNASVDKSSLSIPYGGSATLTLTPATGYYLDSYSCPTGYSCTKADDSPISTGDNAGGQGTQTVKVSNNNTTSGGALTFTGSKRNLEVAITPSTAASTSTNSLSIPYGGSATFTLTPVAGYYLTGVTCSSGYTCSGYTTGSASDPKAAARGAQTITVTNNSSTNTGAVSFTLDNKYRISFSKTNISSPSSSYVDVAYGGSTTVTVTPASGYYLSAFSGCPSGWSCTGVSTGTSKTSAQTLTLTNNSSVNTGTLTMTGTTSDPWAGCSTTAGTQCTVAGVVYIRLKDGHWWTKSSQGSTTWTNLSSVSCPSGTSKPTAAVFDSLIAQYGGSRNSSYGDPYGYYAASAALYNATGWSGLFWSTTEYNSSNAWYLYVSSSYSFVTNYYKSLSYRVVCYR